MLDPTTIARYRYWRAQLASRYPTLPCQAREALAYVRYQDRMRAMLDRFGAWQWESAGCGTFAYADAVSTPAPGMTLRVLVGDDDQPVDWGDLEPTAEEREHARAFCVAVQVLDPDGAELYHDGIGGVDVIDLDGYLQRDWEDAAAYALVEHLCDEATQWARDIADEAHKETAERAYWAARDVVTTDA